MQDRQSEPLRRYSFASGRNETLIAFGVQAWTLVAGLATQSVLAWMLGPAGRGAYAVCLLFAAIMAGVFNSGIDRAAQYFVMSNRQSMSEGTSVAIITAAVGGGAGVVLGALLIYAPIDFFRKADAASFWIALPLIPLTIAIANLQLQLAGQRRFASLARLMVAQTTANLALMLLLIRLLGLGVHGALVALVGSSTLMLALLFVELRRACGFRLLLPAASRFREVLAYGARYYLASIGNMVDLALSTFVIATLGSSEDVGLFAAASALTLKVLVFPDSVEAVLLPRITASPDRSIKLVAQCLRLTALFTGLATAGIVVVSVPLVTVFLSPRFLPSVPLIWILAPGVFMYGSSQILMAYFRATNRPGICSLVMWTGFVANVIVLIVLYPIVGLPSAAWAMTCSFASRSLVLFVAYCRISGRSALETVRLRREDLQMIKRLLWRA